MKKQTLLIFLLILALTLSACQANSDLATNREKWNAAGVNHYTFELLVSCFCPFSEIMPITVEVKDGQIVSMTDVNGQAVEGEFAQYIEEAASMDRLFALAEKNAAEADEIQVTYDAQYGFPAAINVDFIKLAVDDEISYYVNNFKPLP
jgi:hypothetical protein